MISNDKIFNSLIEGTDQIFVSYINDVVRTDIIITRPSDGF